MLYDLYESHYTGALGLSIENDYSAYRAHLTGLLYVRGLLTGFTFTVITFLLTQLQDPSQYHYQIVLFVLTILYNISLFLLYDVVMSFTAVVKIVPFKEEQTRLHNRLEAIFWVLWGSTTAILYVLWGLTYLAMFTGLIGALFLVVAFFYTTKPAAEYRKQWQRP